MSPAVKALHLEAMTVDEQIALLTEIWQEIATGKRAGLLTDAQRAELGSRVSAHETNPDDVVPWEESKTSALRRIEK